MFGLSIANLVAVGLATLLFSGGLARLLRREPDGLVRRIIILGLGAKIAGSAAYYWVIGDVYGGGDVDQYVRVGRDISSVIRSGSMPEQASLSGTQFMEFLAGVHFAVFGPNEIVAYLMFSMLAFAGMLAFVKAIDIGAPRFDRRRYTALLLLMPTMIFWTSTVGKDAWLVFTLGISAYGGARVLKRVRFGYPMLALGVAGVAMVRPHMAPLFALSFGLAYAVRLRDREIKRGLVGWVAGLALVAAAVALTATNFSEEMGSGEATEDSAVDRIRSDADGIFEKTERNTQLTGGSNFDSRPVRGPGDFLHALITVPFRPFPTEAHNLQSLLLSFEGLTLLLLGLAALPRLLRLSPTVLRRPYVILATVYSIGFIIAFSNVGNFGILTRQRSQFLPFLLVLFVASRRGGTSAPDGNEVREAATPPPVLVPVAPVSSPTSRADVRQRSTTAEDRRRGYDSTSA